MREREQIVEYQRRYAAALHAVQAGVGLAMAYDPKSTPLEAVTALLNRMEVRSDTH